MTRYSLSAIQGQVLVFLSNTSENRVKALLNRIFSHFVFVACVKNSCALKNSHDFVTDFERMCDIYVPYRVYM